MLKHRKIDLACVLAMVLAMALVLLLINGKAWGLRAETAAPPYAARLFGQSRVHSIELVVDEADWLALLQNPREKEYIHAAAVIDGEAFEGLGLRAKGSNSLNQTLKYGSSRFSLKLEFDHFDDGMSYYGLDKLSLNGCFQDNACLKETLTYDMMAHMGVAAPLCSYAFVTVNGEDWGLFTAIEEVEEAFVRRNYGAAHGMLYKPEYLRREDENSDVALMYTGEEFERYNNIFRKSVFDASDADKRRLVESLRKLSAGEELEEAVDIDAVLRYFAVQSFVVNLDGYLGATGHNYFLYEEEGRLSMLPWDYNLAYGTYAQGVGSRMADATALVNQPIDTPAPPEILLRRPMFTKLMAEPEYARRYHEHCASFIESYFDSGAFEQKLEETLALISPYVRRDPSKFCSHEDFLLAADTLKTFCLLRAESVRGQLGGSIPSTTEGQALRPEARVDASMIQIADLGDFEDMRNLVDGRLPG